MIKAEDIRIGIVGLGYVGLPLSLLFAKRYPTVGYDCNGRRVAELLQADDTTKETDAAQLQQALRDGRLTLSDKPEALKDCNVYIVAVPTPVDCNNHPDLEPLVAASRIVGSLLAKGDINCAGQEIDPNQDLFTVKQTQPVNPLDQRKARQAAETPSGVVRTQEEIRRAEEEARLKREEEERIAREEAEEKAREEARIRKENSFWNKAFKGLKEFGKKMVEEEE